MKQLEIVQQYQYFLVQLLLEPKVYYPIYFFC